MNEEEEAEIGIDIPQTPQKPDFFVIIKGNKKIVIALIAFYLLGFLSGYIYVKGGL